MLQVFNLCLYHSSYIEDEVRRTVLSWISSNVTMLYGHQRKEILQTTAYDEEQVSESVVTKLASLILQTYVA